LASGKNPLLALVDGFKRAMIRALSEAFAERALASKFAALLGVGMSRAADAKFSSTMVTVPGVGSVPTGANGGVADASTVFRPPMSAAQTAAGYGGAALGAASAGYSVGGSLYSNKHGTTGNMVRGGLAGAVTGAAIGTMIMPGIGTAVGALIGLTAGLFGMAAAAKASAAQTREMRAAVAATMDGLRAEVSGNAQAEQLAQIKARSASIRKQIEEAYAGGDKNSATVRERNKLLAETNRLEAERIKQLEQEVAVLQRRAIEDYEARAANATPGNEAGDALADFDRKQQREREDLVLSFGSVIDAFEQARLNALDNALAAERLQFTTEQAAAAADGAATALDGLTTSVRNAPSGFKIERYTYANAVPKSVSGLDNIPSAFSPPSVPFSRPSQASSSIGTVNVTLPGVTNAKQFVEELDKIRLQTVGMNGTRSQALERM
jgi:hypothetical protein